MKSNYWLVLFSLFLPLDGVGQCRPDTLSPTFSVVQGSTLLEPSGYSEMWAIDFVLNATDNCTKKKDLVYTFYNASPIGNKINQMHFFKNDGEDATEIEYEYGLAQKWQPEYQSSSLNLSKCYFDNPAMLSITVQDSSHNKRHAETSLNMVGNTPPCTNMIITVSDAQGNQLPNITAEITTQATGSKLTYTFDKQLKTTLFPTTFCINLTSSDVTAIGYTTRDIMLLRDHVLGIKKLKSPLALIAADVNQDNKISASDLVLLRKLYIGLVKAPQNLIKIVTINHSNCVTITPPKPVVVHATAIKLGKISDFEK